MGILLIPKAGPQAEPIGGRAHAVGFKNGQQVAVPMPNPALAGYGPARDRFDHWRNYASPLGGVSPAPWGTPPAGLRPEFRRVRRWGGS